VNQQSLARVAQILGAFGQEKDSKAVDKADRFGEFDGDEIDDDLVFSTVPERNSLSTNNQIHFDEIDDDEMRRCAESLEQEQSETQPNEQDQKENDPDDDQLCQDYATKMQTPTKSTQTQSRKRKQRCLEDLDALLDNDGEEQSNEDSNEPQQISPVFKKKP
jgi:hypothetical protein